jgi:hypothetical protein
MAGSTFSKFRRKVWPELSIPFYREFRIMLQHQWKPALIFMFLGLLLTVTVHTSFFSFMHHKWGQIEAFQFWARESGGHRIYGRFHFYLVLMLLYELPFLIFYVFSVIQVMWTRKPSPQRARRRIIFGIWLIASLFSLWLPAFWTNVEGDRLWNWAFSPAVDDKYHVSHGFHIWLLIQCLLVVFVTGWIHLNHGRVFHALVDYWTVGSFLAYSYAGEKVPWVLAHIMVPMMISCGLYADRLRLRFFAGSIESAGPGADAEKVSSGSFRHATKPLGGPWHPGRIMIGATWAVACGWTWFVGFRLCFIQPGDAIERHSYASSHSEFHAAMRHLIRECHEKYRGYETTIAYGGQPGWPLVWTLRNFKRAYQFTMNPDPTSVARGTYSPNTPSLNFAGEEPVFVIMDNEMMEHWQPPPQFKPRYEWGKTALRHFWQPLPLDWKAMRKLKLLLHPDSSLSTDQAALKHKARREWMKMLHAYFVRDEQMTANGKWSWPSLGGYNAYFGRLNVASTSPRATDPPS